jgi:hypothetical protein
VTVTEPPGPDDTNPWLPIVDPVSQFSDPALVNFYAESPAHDVGERTYPQGRPRYVSRRRILPIAFAIGAILIAILIIVLTSH